MTVAELVKIFAAGAGALVIALFGLLAYGQGIYICQSVNCPPSLNGILLSNNTFNSGAPSGTVVGSLSVTTTGQPFSGSYAAPGGADGTHFQVINSNQLATNGVVAAAGTRQDYNIAMTATQASAVNTSITVPITVTAQQVPTAVVFTPPGPVSVQDNITTATTISVVSVTTSDTHTFFGTLSLTANAGGRVTLSGSNVVPAHNFTSADDGSNLTVTVQASENGTTVSANLTLNVTAVVSGTAQSPGPSAALYNMNGTASSPYYICNTNRYVSASATGSGNGLSAGSPWTYAQGLAYAPVANSGSCINMAPGIYALTSEQDYTHGGNAAAPTGYLVWRCSTMPFSFSSGVLQGEGSGCVLRMTAITTGTINGVNSGANYLMFDGIEWDGNNFTATQFCSVFQNGSPPSPHHVWIFNSDLHHCGFSGVQWNNSDWLFAIHNVWHDNGPTSSGSGLSMYEPLGLTGYTPTTQDNAWCSATSGLCYHIVIAYNVGFHNHNSTSGTGDTDGEGIILDDWGWTQNSCPTGATCPYTASGLVMGNIMWWNGGGGIQAVQQHNGKATFVNNTTYNNYWDAANTGTWRSNFEWAFSEHGHFYNNIAIAGTVASGAQCGSLVCTYLAQGQATPTDNIWQNNWSSPAVDGGIASPDTFPTGGATGNHDNADPGFRQSLILNSSTNNFAISPTSPAAGSGQNFDLWQQSTTQGGSGVIDAGACVSSLTNCP